MKSGIALISSVSAAFATLSHRETWVWWYTVKRSHPGHKYFSMATWFFVCIPMYLVLYENRFGLCRFLPKMHAESAIILFLQIHLLSLKIDAYRLLYTQSCIHYMFLWHSSLVLSNQPSCFVINRHVNFHQNWRKWKGKHQACWHTQKKEVMSSGPLLSNKHPLCKDFPSRVVTLR